jgi:hypothetical protein
MKGKPVLYKSLVVGVIVLFILTNFSVTPCLSAPNNTNKCGWVPFDNQPPESPEIDGPLEWPPGVEICFTFRSFDPNHDDIMFIIDWGDGTFEETNYFQHDIPVEVCHTYEEKGSYLLRARGIDIYGYEGEWSTFYIPINKDNCELCPKVSNQQINRLINLLDKLEKYDNQLLVLSKQYPELEDKYQKVSEITTDFKEINKGLKQVAKEETNLHFCDVLLPITAVLLLPYILYTLSFRGNNDNPILRTILLPVVLVISIIGFTGFILYWTFCDGGMPN